MIARSTADDVEVHTLPSADFPTAHRRSLPRHGSRRGPARADELVAVSLGPVFFDGASWYQVSAVDGGDKAFAYGWVSGEFLVRESDAPDGSPQVVTVHGLGTGTEVSTPVPAGTPISVDLPRLQCPTATAATGRERDPDRRGRC